MIRITGLRLLPQEGEKALAAKIKKRLRLNSEGALVFTIVKKSLDARKKDHIYYTVTVDVQVENEKKILAHCGGKDVCIAPDSAYQLPSGSLSASERPVVVGFGPGGMFAALALAQMGLRPIVLERGEEVDVRAKRVEAFWNGQEGLQEQSNVQFGEGGAGAFSDGKLTTRSKDVRCQKVLHELVAAGAPKEILYENKPHIGTDLLQGIVRNIRNTVIELGGEVRFNSRLTDIQIVSGRVAGGVINDRETFSASHLILSTGHSARDIYELLYEKGVRVAQKPFAVGLRIEHPQEMVNVAQYGEMWPHLGAADYQLTWGAKEGADRGVYTFCMCPGGHVVCAPSEPGRLAINGMSYHARDGKNANSAVLVQVFEKDFPSNHPLAGIALQRQLEEAAYNVGGGNYLAPVQRLGQFLGMPEQAEKQWDIVPTCRPGAVETDFTKILPSYITQALQTAIPAMGRKLKGFDHPEAILTGIETRSSSPVRIVRGESYESINTSGLYPVGEGAGYAGGIVSSAIDGIAAAEKIFESLSV